MISLADFKLLIEGIKSSDKENLEFSEAIGKYNTSFTVFDFASKLKSDIISVVNHLLELPEGDDTISWWMYENIDHCITESRDGTHIEWYLDSIEMLYIYLCSCSDKKEYNFPELCKYAEGIAIMAHKEQKDKAGKPYIEHIRAVASGVKTDEQKIIAYLHDIIEDTDCTAIDLFDKGFPPHIINSVNLLTRKNGEDYFKHVERIKLDDNARVVKISDLTHNMDIDRISNPTQKDLKRVEKYKKAYSILTCE